MMNSNKGWYPSYCFSNMFEGCTALTSIPPLRNTAIGSSVFTKTGICSAMYKSCAKLSSIPSDMFTYFIPSATTTDGSDCSCNYM